MLLLGKETKVLLVDGDGSEGSICFTKKIVRAKLLSEEVMAII